MSRDQIQQVVERALKTFAQSFAAVILASDVVDIWSVDWAQAAGVAALAAVLSVLTSLGSWNIGQQEGPSLVPVDPPVDRSPSSDGHGDVPSEMGD